MGTEGESLEAPPETKPQPRAAGQGQSQHHQGGESGVSCSPVAFFNIPTPPLFVILNKREFFLCLSAGAGVLRPAAAKGRAVSL